ncbi:hypothetical protein AVEN_5490-1 [Araneus ventricosus]|uniref:Uncharacterized protein n=1 Tax=Araneus ventricosus TaxID=182803 RepID=A0A4Y2MRP6_ARAVE|nr:hypothetical protein AVEN_5490-1 [Araneus ventricosus]
MPETGPLTRSMDKQFEKLFAMMEEMRVAQAGLIGTENGSWAERDAIRTRENGERTRRNAIRTSENGERTRRNEMID